MGPIGQNGPKQEFPIATSFKSLGLSKDLLRALKEQGYSAPTPIQQGAISPALKGRDVLGCAQTGTGKTASFCLPMLQRIFELSGDEPEIRGLIVTPTRELAAQIVESLKAYGKHLDLWHAVIFGGVKQERQVAELRRGVDIVVATPGRLLDLMSQGIISLHAIEVFVLDEADRMLDMGFIHDVKKIVKELPKKRQTMFFSATMPPDIRKLADKLLHKPESVVVAPVSSTAEAIEQGVYLLEKRAKRQLLVKLLKGKTYTRTLVFSRTKHGANRIVKHLVKAGIEAAAIHGNKSQGARTKALGRFRSGEIGVLVATDIAARGIDVDDVSHVINFDLPNIAETYVHRIGRTARAGKSGKAVSFCDQSEEPYLRSIEKLIKTKVPRLTMD